jgi:hypothetical protein
MQLLEETEHFCRWRQEKVAKIVQSGRHSRSQYICSFARTHNNNASTSCRLDPSWFGIANDAFTLVEFTRLPIRSIDASCAGVVTTAQKLAVVR